MSIAKYLVCGILILVLVGCGTPCIDGSSDDAFKASIVKVRSSLPEQQQDEFDKAMMTIAFDGTDIFKAAAGGSELMVGQMHAKLNGLTGEQILSKAAAVKSRPAAKAEEMPSVKFARKEIATLEEKQKQDVEADKILATFTIKDVSLSQAKHEFLGMLTTLKMTVRNGTSQPVKSVNMSVTITSDGRTIPWLVEEIGKEVAGGLEPGEEKVWELSYNDGSWRHLVVTPDMHALVVPTVLFGAKDSIIARHAFSLHDQDELRRLRVEIGETNESATRPDAAH